MSTTTAANTKYVYISADKRVRIILVDVDEYGVTKISGDVESSSRPGVYHHAEILVCLLYTSPSPRDRQKSRMPSSA